MAFSSYNFTGECSEWNKLIGCLWQFQELLICMAVSVKGRLISWGVKAVLLAVKR